MIHLACVTTLALLGTALPSPGQWSSLLNGSQTEPVTADIAFPLKKAWELKAKSHWGFRSSPAIHDGTVYIGSMSSTFYAVDAASGAIHWEKQVGDRIEFSSPAADANGVYVGCEDGNLYAFDHGGRERWKTPTGAKIESSPIIHGDLVLVGNNAGTVLALNRAHGSITWKATCDGPVFSRPTVANDTVYVGTEGFEGGTLYALALRDGDERFTFRCGHIPGHDKARGGIYSTVLHANGRVIFGSMDGNLYCLNAAGGSEIWRYTLEKGIAGSPAMANGVIVVGAQDRHWHGIDAATGAPKWRTATDRFYPNLRSPVIVNDMAIVQYEYKVVGLSLSNGEQVGHFDLTAEDGPADGLAVAVAGNRIYTCTRFKVLCLATE